MATNLLLSPEIQIAYNRKLLSRFRADTVFNRFGAQDGISKGGGVMMSWRRMEIIRPVGANLSGSFPIDSTYSLATAALLTEGTFAGPSVIASWAEVTATVREYGQAAYVSKWNDTQAIDPQVPEYVTNFGESMGELLDLVTRDVLVSATNVQYANGKASQSAVISGDFMTLLEIRKAVKTLKRANAKPVPAAGNRFPLLVHTDTTFDLQSDTNITNIWQYGGAGSRQADIFDATFQDLPFGVRVYESTLCPLKAASGYTDYYTSFLLGKDAYGTLKLDALPAKIIVHEPGSSGVSDPLDQVGTVGWKANWAAVILNQNNLVRIVHQTSSFVGTRSAAL